MSVIIPYHKDLDSSGGAFIRPDGEILHLDDNRHEEFAERYCNGRDFKIYTGAEVGPPAPVLTNLEAEREVLQAKKGFDIFRSSDLSKFQLAKYKFWLEHQNPENKISYADFLVFVLAYDKVETLVHGLITTTAAEPHVRFFNYYLMDWKIAIEKRLVYDYHRDTYYFLDNQFLSVNEEDREAEEEIEDIKKHVLVKDRPYFFKE